MTKPRVFVSSTYYDLKYIRSNLERFISQMGYDPVLFESGDIAYEHDKPLDESAYKEIDNCHMQILIIGGRYGSPTSSSTESLGDDIRQNKKYEHYNSITRAEYEKARKNGMPIFIFVDKGVYSEYQTYKKNRENEKIKYAHVDNINIFKLLDEISTQKVGHYIKDFEKFEDIASWLTEQWAGLFTNYLMIKNTEQKIKTLESQIDELKSIMIVLKEYIEALMKKIEPENYGSIIQQQDKNLDSKQAERFFNETSIDYILNMANLGVQPEDLFNNFKKSKSIREFMKYIGAENFYDSNSVIQKQILDNEFLFLKKKYSV